MVARRSRAFTPLLAAALAAGWLVVAAVSPVSSASPAWAAGSHVEAKAWLEYETIGVEQSTVLIIAVESSGLSTVGFKPDFSVENLEVAGQPSRSQKVSYVNGRATRSDSLSWYLRPLAVGPARVHGIKVEVEEKVFVLDDLALTVQEEPADLSGQRRGAIRDPFEELEDLWDPFGRRRRRPQPAYEPKVFLRAEALPQDPYVGQQVLYTLYLFTQADVGAINPEELPEFRGVWVHEIPQPEQQRAEMTEVQDERYGRVVLLRKALFPLRDGRLDFGPVTARLAIKVPDRSVFGPLLDRTREIQRTSNGVSIDVKPLPPAPAGYHGAVGQLNLTAELEPAQVEEGMATTLTVSLSGEGHIQGLAAPELTDLDGVRRFPPEQSGSDRVLGTRVTGERSWKYVLVPDRAGQWELPPIDYPYFDPKAGEYRFASVAALPLLATPGVASEANEAAAMAEAEAGAEREEDSSAATGATGATGSAALPRTWILGAAALLPLLFFLAFKTVRVTGRKRREAQRLKERLRAAVQIRQPRRAADEIEASWLEFLTRRWGFEPTRNSRQWGDLLDEHGADTHAVEQMDRLAEDLHYLRFAPELSSTGAVRDDVMQRSLRLLRQLG